MTEVDLGLVVGKDGEGGGGITPTPIIGSASGTWARKIGENLVEVNICSNVTGTNYIPLVLPKEYIPKNIVAFSVSAHAATTVLTVMDAVGVIYPADFASSSLAGKLTVSVLGGKSGSVKAHAHFIYTIN